MEKIILWVYLTWRKSLLKVGDLRSILTVTKCSDCLDWLETPEELKLHRQLAHKEGAKKMNSVDDDSHIADSSRFAEVNLTNLFFWWRPDDREDFT